MLDFPQNQFQVKSKKAREELDKTEEIWKKNFQGRLMKSSLGVEAGIIAPLTETTFPISQKHSAYSDMPYGRKGTVGEGGCGPLAVEYALRLMGLDVTFLDVLEQCDYKGYRAYEFNSRNQIIGACGTEYALFNNLAIEVFSYSEMLRALENGKPVTLLVSNAIYYNDSSRKGNHFVTMIGVGIGEEALIMDGNRIVNSNEEAKVAIPLKELLPGIKAAWFWEKENVKSYL